MIKFRQKIFAGAMVGEEYKTRKQKVSDDRIAQAKDQLEKYKEEKEALSKSGQILKTPQAGFKKFKTKKDKAKEGSLKNLLRLEENKKTKEKDMKDALLKHGINYGKKGIK